MNTINTLTYTEEANGDITAIDGVGTTYSKINGRYYRTPVGGKKTRIGQEMFEIVVDEIRAYIAEQNAITPEDIERDARELEAYIAEAEESNTDLEVAEIADLYCRHPEGTDLEVPAVLNQYGCVDCSKCNVQNCVHRDCMRRNPTSEGGLAECPRLRVKEEQELDDMAEDDNVSLEEYTEKLEKVEREKKIRRERKAKAARKNAAFTYTVNGEVIVTLTEKQVDFVKHLPDTCFWEDGLDSCIWVDCLCDDIGGQFAGKPMTVGAMVSTLCEKGLAVRSKNRVNGKKCTGFALTPLGKRVFANPEWGLY